MTNDFCTAQGTDMLEPSGDDVEFSATQYLASCTWRLRKHDVTQVDVTENANRASQVTANPSAKRTTVAGQRVDVEPLERDSGICNRWVYGRGVVVTVQGYAISVPHTSPDICRAADRVVRTTAELLASGKHTPLTLADPTISDLDMCKVVTAGHLMNAAVLAKASQNSFNFDADCEVSSSTVTFFVDSAIAHPGAQENHVPRSIGKHTVLASTNNDKSYCAYSAPQGATGSQSDHESIEFSMNASSISNPPKQLCAKTLQLVAAFLDAGGLR